MTYRTRIGILIGFIALFLITTPLVIIYTAGYRWNEKKFRLEKVGIIYLRSKPSGADIFLNGELRDENTPARLRNLLPDTYEVKVAKLGYAPWFKRLPVESAKATFAEGVILWKNAQPEKLNLAAKDALDKTELAALNRPDQLTYKVGEETFKSDGFEIWVENKNGDKETITRLSHEIIAILPYTDTGWVIYETADEIRAIERDGRDERNDTLLAAGKNLNGLAVSSDGKTLYFGSNEKTPATLYRRLLQ